MGNRPVHRAIYTGSFDPITLGHVDVIRRGRMLFDDLIIAIGRNINKREMFPQAQRKAMVDAIVADLMAEAPDGGEISVATYEGLTLDFAQSVNANVILRGIRNITDLAYECQLAMTNRQVANLETVFIMTSQIYSYTSSNLIKQIAAMGGDLDKLSGIVPRIVIDALKDLKRSRGLDYLIEDGGVD